MENLTIAMPESGVEELQPAEGQNLAFSFDATDVLFNRSDADLIIQKAEGGASVVLKGFFATGDAPLPSIVMEDGAVVDSAELLAAYAPDMDISTAAGPSSSTQASGGAGEYGDNAGALIGSVDRLGSLGTDRWSVQGSEPLTTTNIEEEASSASASTSAPLVSGTTPSGPSTPPSESVTPPSTLEPAPSEPGTSVPGEETPIVPEDSSPGLERLVLYTRGAYDDYNSYNWTSQISDGSADLTSENGYVLVTLAADGSLIITLSDAGTDALNERYVTGNETLVDYVTYTGADGKQYRAQVIVTTSYLGEFDSSLYEDVAGETHYGFTSGTYEINSSDGDRGDLLQFQGGVHGASTISTGLGNDTISSVAVGSGSVYGFSSGAHVDTGAGDDSISVAIAGSSSNYGMYGTQIDTGEGNDTVSIAVSNNPELDSSSQSLFGVAHSDIVTGTGDDSVSISVSAEKGQSLYSMFDSSIDTGKGDDTVSISVSGDGSSYTGVQNSSIDTGDGDDNVNISISGDGMSHTAMYSSSIDTGDGNDSISINISGSEGGFGYEGMLVSQINTGSGDDHVDITVSNKMGATGISNSTIDTGEGNDHVSIVASSEANPYAVAYSTIDTGAGDDYVSIVATVRESDDMDIDSTMTTAVAMVESTVSLGEGNDTLEITGDIYYSTISAGDGNDLIRLSSGSASYNGTTIDGGSGLDVLQLDGYSLDLSTTVLKGIEVIDMTGGADSTLNLSLDSLLSMASTLNSVTLDNGDNTTGLFIKGDENDSVTGLSGFTSGATVSYEGTTYTEYTAGSGSSAVTVFLENGINIV